MDSSTEIPDDAASRTLYMQPHRTLIDALACAPDDRLFITEWIDEDVQPAVTFRQFRDRASAQALLLREHGVGSGDRVVIIMPQGILQMAAFVGAMLIGAVPAILAYPNFKVEPAKYRAGLEGVMANLDAKAVLIDHQFPQELLENLNLEEAQLLRVLDGAPQHSVAEFDAKITGDSLAFIQHSAGTTGLQKGVALTHAAVLRHLDNLISVLGIDRDLDKIYSWLPLYHDMGLIACFMLPMVAHISVVMQSPLHWVMQPDTMLQIFTEHRCTLAWLPNFSFQFVARRTPSRRRNRYDLSSARALINCSEPVRHSSMAEFHEAFSSCGLRSSALQASYAMAENVFAVTQTSLVGTKVKTLCANGKRFRADNSIVLVGATEPDAMRFTSSGEPLPDTEVRILSEAGELLPEGRVGEIAIRSRTLFSGYFNRPDLTNAALRDGWYFTGDLGFILAGELYVVGRKKDLLIVGGENIYPQDIEEIVASHPAIHDGRVIAFGLFNPELGTEDIVIVAEMKDESSTQDTSQVEKQVRESVVANLGFAPKQIFFKPPRWIVKSTAGKPARSATREKLCKEHPGLNPEVC